MQPALSSEQTELAVQENVPLAPFTTFGIGGPARWFVTATTEAQVQQAVALAERNGWPLFVLGGGSNLLVSDAGFPGLVLHIAIKGLTAGEPNSQDYVNIDVAAGESWDALVQFAVDRDLAGIECLAGIPGTVGGTPVQNVGAYGQEVSQTITHVRCFDRATGARVKLDNAACGFAYRTSLLNTSQRGRHIVTSVRFALKQYGAPNLAYADLQRRFPAGTQPSLAETAEAVRAIRRGKGMVVDPADPDSRSAGSFFKNPLVDGDRLAAIANAAGLEVSAVPHWPADGGRIKLPAAWLLEKAGFPRGYTLGAAGISSKHTLALINRGGAHAGDIANLRERIVQGVRQKFGVELEQEPVEVR